MKRCIAHEGTGGDQLVLDINVSFSHVLVHMFAAHLLQDPCCPCIWPPEGRNRGTVRTVECISLFTSDGEELFHSRFTLFVLSHSELTAWQEFGGEDGGDAAHAQRFTGLVESLDELLQLWLDGAVLILHCPVTQVLSHTETP